jgi:hypothetical protein
MTNFWDTYIGWEMYNGVASLIETSSAGKKVLMIEPGTECICLTTALGIDSFLGKETDEGWICPECLRLLKKKS